MDKYCETKLISKMDIYFKTEGVDSKNADVSGECYRPAPPFLVNLNYL